MSNQYQINYNQSLVDVLKSGGFSLLLTTYQAGKLIILCAKEDQIDQLPVTIKKPMGVAIQGSKLAIASIDEIQIFSREEQDRVRKKPELTEFDCIYLHRATYHTSPMDLHDLEFGEGLIWGVNTMFSCLSIHDVTYSFRPKWKPPFISELVPEDRCHLNGMAMVNNLPKYVTALSQDNTKQGCEKISLRLES
jgi:uncharacterized protein (TIGR03032 family)